MHGGYRLLAEGKVGFILEAYDPTQTLFIDPILSYSTVFGGASIDEAVSVALDSDGYIYVAGTTSSKDFPAAGPLQSALNKGLSSSRDAFVAKLTPDGSQPRILYIPRRSEDRAGLRSCDRQLEERLCCRRDGFNRLPDQEPFSAGHWGNQDAFIARLNAQGADLVFASYLGGSDWDRGFSVAVDSQGRACLAGATKSTNFPTPNGWKTAPAGAVEAFAARLKADGSGLDYSTYLAGSADDYAQGIAVDAAGNVYVAGYTSSDNFPVQNPLQASHKDMADIFVTKLNPTGSAAVYSTYMGTIGSDQAFSIAVDSAGCAYVTGLTGSQYFPTTGTPSKPRFPVTTLTPSSSS